VAVVHGGQVVAQGWPEAVLTEPLLQGLYGPRVRVAHLGGRPHVYLDG
jgi:iron complex transport system ATP-binding protein